MIRSDLFGMQPGFTSASETYESEFSWGRASNRLITGGNLSGAARDSGNTPTTILRPGLLLGRISASGKLTNYSPTATDGSNYVEAVLMSSFRMQDLDASNIDRLVWILVGGPVQASKLINLDHVARSQMRGRFTFDDDFANTRGYQDFHRETAKTADYTVVAADAGTLFTTTGAAGAVNFTLPALAAGLGPFGFLNTVDQNLTVTSAAGDDIVTDGDAAADSVAFSTASHKIGGFVKFWVNAAGTKWYMESLGPPACVITVAT